MPKKFSEVLKLMVEQAGVSATDATIKSILENSALDKIEVSDEVSTKLTAERMTMDAAKNNPDLHKHFKAIHLNGADAEVERIANDYGLSDEDKDTLKKADNSYKRIGILAERLKLATEKKASATGKDKTALEKEIEKLNQQVLEEKTSYENKIKELNTSFENERNQFRLGALYGKFIPQMDKTKSSDLNHVLIDTVAKREMQKKGLNIVTKDGNLSLVTKEGTDYYENNQPVTVESFIQKSLANEKLLVASGPSGSGGNKGNGRTEPVSTENGKGLNTAAFLEATEQE